VKSSLLIPFLFAISISLMAGEAFESASSVDEVRRQIERLPKDNVWWTVNGKDMAWNNKNLQRMFPTVPVYRDGPVRKLVSRPNPAIAEFTVDTPAGKMGFRQFLDSPHSTTMAVVILHRGEIVFEHYPGQQPYEKPIYWSVTKALVATVLAILEDRGQVDVDKSIETYIPELGNSSFSGITIRNFLDMASGVDCPEEYEKQDACYYIYSKTIGDGYWTVNSPDNPYEYLAQAKLDRWAEQGTSFSYSGVNTFILGWLVEKITGMPFHDAFTKEIWRHIGAENDAAFLAPRFGVPNTHGGFMARPRDLARFGLLFTPSYRLVSYRKIISDRYLDVIINGGRPELMKNARFGSWATPGFRHNVYQWDAVWDNNDFFKGGWAGQGLLINSSRDLVAVWAGHFREDGSETDPTGMIRSILESLYGEKH